jgi:hypothetical protein
MYTLYHNKRESIIEVKKATKGMSHCTYTDDVAYYNDCYYLCTKRKPLVEKANEIKQSWIDELEQKLADVAAIKI